MAVPKRRVSHSKSAKRKTHYKIALKRPVKDNDGSWKMPHMVNPEQIQLESKSGNKT